MRISRRGVLGQSFFFEENSRGDEKRARHPRGGVAGVPLGEPFVHEKNARGNDKRARHPRGAVADVPRGAVLRPEERARQRGSARVTHEERSQTYLGEPCLHQKNVRGNEKRAHHP
jgi:hypothetical protein